METDHWGIPSSLLTLIAEWIPSMHKPDSSPALFLADILHICKGYYMKVMPHFADMYPPGMSHKSLPQKLSGIFLPDNACMQELLAVAGNYLDCKLCMLADHCLVGTCLLGTVDTCPSNHA